MLAQSEAKIYLAGSRGNVQSYWYNCYHTFNQGAYFEESRTPYGNLHKLDDTTLKPEHTLWQRVEHDSLVFLLPIVGGLTVKAQLPTENRTMSITHFVEAGEAFLFILPKGAMYVVSNPYEKSWVNFLQIELCPAGPYKPGKVNFESKHYSNKLFSLLADRMFSTSPTGQNIWIGKYEGRKSGTYTPDTPGKNVFVYVVDGAFEVQNRLLEARDGLALNDVTSVEFEALSGEAVLLVIEEGGRGTVTAC